MKELKELYRANHKFFSEEIDSLEKELLNDKWPEEKVKPLITILKTGLMKNEFFLVNGDVHISTFNIICFKIRDKTDIPIEQVKECIRMILDAMGYKIIGSTLDTLNVPMEED